MTEATIDLGAYRRNLATIASTVAPASVMAVVKADAYGHGLLPVARAAFESGIRWFGSLDIATGLALRDGGIDEEAAILAWLFGVDEDYAAAIDAGVDLGISTVAQLEQITAAGDGARLHLKIDTGLHRNGASLTDWPQLVSRAVELVKAGRIDLVGVFTHIAEASDDEDSLAIARFHDAIAIAQRLGAAFEVRHLAASAASFARADARFDLVRVGAFAYGIAPGGGIGPHELGLAPVMTLTAPVVVSGEQSSVIGIGLAHGISSAVVGAVSVALGGRLHPVTTIDAGTMTVAGPGGMGDTAVLFGTGLRGEQTLQQWADATGTIGEE
ncbi:MAG: alanine racemase, partial [Actinomycetota bacterium]